jgi:hypothetical protein
MDDRTEWGRFWAWMADVPADTWRRCLIDVASDSPHVGASAGIKLLASATSEQLAALSREDVAQLLAHPDADLRTAAIRMLHQISHD